MIFPSALRPHPLTAIFLWSYGRAPSRQYFLRPCSRAPSRRFSLALRLRLLDLQVRTVRSESHSLWCNQNRTKSKRAIRIARPLTVIFLWPYGLAPSPRYSFGLAAAPPRGDINFLFTSKRLSIFLCLTARIDFISLTAIHTSRRYQFSLCLTAIIDFSLPHGKNQFHST
jgi:hypothetical protein